MEERGWAYRRRQPEATVLYAAVHLVERVLPHVPYRQWTLSFPHRVRWVLLKDAGLLSDVLTLFLRAVFAHAPCRPPAGWAAWAGVCLKRAAPPLHRPGAQPWRHPSAAFLAPSAPALTLNRAPIPPIRKSRRIATDAANEPAVAELYREPMNAAARGFNPDLAPRAGTADGTAVPPPPPGRRTGGQATARGRRAARETPRKSGASSPRRTARARPRSPPA
jgi:hypothetical protein